jgi:hypothetical protein
MSDGLDTRMPDDAGTRPEPTVSRENKLSSMLGIFSVTSLIALAIVAWLVFQFFSGGTYRFYASALFSFYALTKHMWVSVMLLGVFQTLILIPVRIIRVQRQNNIKEFQKTISKAGDSTTQVKQLHKKLKLGNKTFSFYLVDFMVQLTTFLTMGRLFLTDFYSVQLDPSRLFSFVPYPEYPIMHTWFKLPYLAITETVNLGFKWVLIGWLILVGLYLIIQVIRKTMRRFQAKHVNSPPSKILTKYTGGSMVLIMLVVWFLLTHVPTGMQFKIFTGDVSVPNRMLNSITAFTTFFLLLWFAIPKIIRTGRMAVKKGIPIHKVEEVQQRIFKESVFSAVLIGLGAFFITNHIPSAFELSIFTLEIISLASPFTLDKWILKNQNRKMNDQSKNVSSE